MNHYMNYQMSQLFGMTQNQLLALSDWETKQLRAALEARIKEPGATDVLYNLEAAVDARRSIVAHSFGWL